MQPHQQCILKLYWIKWNTMWSKQNLTYNISFHGMIKVSLPLKVYLPLLSGVSNRHILLNWETHTSIKNLILKLKWNKESNVDNCWALLGEFIFILKWGFLCIAKLPKKKRVNAYGLLARSMMYLYKDNGYISFWTTMYKGGDNNICWESWGILKGSDLKFLI